MKGTVWTTVRQGKTVRSSSLLCDSANATEVPTTIESDKPISADVKLEMTEVTRILPLLIAAVATSVGFGTRYLGTSMTVQRICQTITIVMNAISGGATFRANCSQTPCRRLGSDMVAAVGRLTGGAACSSVVAIRHPPAGR